MNLALDHFADNPIIDDIVCWPPSPQAIKSIRASNPMFRKPFIEIVYPGGKTSNLQFAKENFALYWSEAVVILETITDIRIVSDFQFKAVENREKFSEDVLAARAESIQESNKMFEQGMYQSFINQYGQNCKNLPADTLQRIAAANEKLIKKHEFPEK